MRIDQKCKKYLKKMCSNFFPQKKKSEDKSLKNVLKEPLEVEEKVNLEPMDMDPEDQELQEAKERYKGKNRDYVWAFTSGHTSDDFRGNPKYLFVYINKYRSDIKAYWLCISEETATQVRNLGYVAYVLDTPAAQMAINYTGVLVAEQVKSVIPEGLENVKYLNLWHGVGIKRIERKQFQGDIALELSRKYVKNNAFYRDHQLLTVTSPALEEEFIEDCGIDSDKVIHSGYLRCAYQQNFEPVCSFNHDIKGVKELPKDTKIAVYLPTFRAKIDGTFSRAIEDMEALYKCCEKNHLLLIFKVHPKMEKEEGFLRAWETYGDRPYFLFWDNQWDFYEIINQIDLAIYDYTSMFSDLSISGVKHYIRYVFDYDEYMADGFTQNEYYSRTVGELCYTFPQLLSAIDEFERKDYSKELVKVNEIIWKYSEGKNDFEKTIQRVMDFKIEKRNFPTLYSFDIFDTLFSRKVLNPEGIFYGVREKMIAQGGFSQILIRRYPEIRISAEMNVRDYYKKTKEIRQSDQLEISFDEIFQRIADVYNLTKEQIQLLEQWELELELENVIPLPKQINLVKELLERGEQVVLISDMYLPKDFIVKMLAKADPVLTQLPLFLSSEYGVQKTTQMLFFEVYKSFEPFYDFKKWIHYGDNVFADQTQARRFRISTRRVEHPEYNVVQEKMVKELASYDAYKVAGMQTRLFSDSLYDKDEFVASFVSLCMVPYVDWAIRDAQRRGYEALYFISRDGYHLKRIADALIVQRGIKMKTKYIYASRRAWKIPSFIKEVDEEFWASYGSFANIKSKDKLFHAMDLDEAAFRKFFPSINPDHIDFMNKEAVDSLIEIFKDSKEYNEYLLETAAEERKLAGGYLKQEIDTEEKFAVVEFWGRGSTQECMVRLWQDAIGDEDAYVPFYYSRSIVPSSGHSIRYNFTTNTTPQLFMEGIFANMPYKSIEGYRLEEGEIVPDIVSVPYDKNLFDSMERILPEFATEYAALELDTPEDTDRLLFDFALDYYKNNMSEEFLTENIGTLVDSVALYGDKREFAPAYTMENLDDFAEKTIGRGSGKITTSISMSVARSSEAVRQRYMEMYQIFPGDDVAKGQVLTDAQMKTNRKFHDRYDKLRLDAETYRKMYDDAAKEYSVTHKIIFITEKKSWDQSGMKLVYSKLADKEDSEVVVLYLSDVNTDIPGTAKELATAKYIVVSKPIAALCEIRFRPETRELLLSDVAFLLNNQYLSTDYLLKWKQKYTCYAAKNDIAVLQVPSGYQEQRFREIYSRASRTECPLLGCCNTDIYYRQEAKKDAKAELIEKFPEAADKKVILYMPTVRTRQNCENWISMIDMGVLQHMIGEQYVVVLNFLPNQLKGEYKNDLEIPGFSKMINNQSILRRLMVASDIIIGDYRDEFYEAALMDKPVYFTVGDYEEIFKKRSMGIDKKLEKYIFGPVVTTANDLTEQLEKSNDYDYTRMYQFRERYLSGCDGQSVDRVAEYLSH